MMWVSWLPNHDPIIAPRNGGVKCSDEGRPPYPPVTILYLLVIAYLYRFSGRQVEAAKNLYLAIK
jgi:hypothetical protein